VRRSWRGSNSRHPPSREQGMSALTTPKSSFFMLLIIVTMSHRIRSLFEEGPNQVLNHVAMLFGQLVLGMLNRLKEIIIAFHTCCLHIVLLGIGIHACKATGNTNFLFQGTYKPAIKGFRPAHTHPAARQAWKQFWTERSACSLGHLQ
jgi:hypothetical protein